jgi:fibronectin type 3 domain-containing protein
LYWSTSSGAAATGVTKSTGTKIENVTSPYAHTGLTNGTTYYYVVTAVNAGGESAESAEVSATPQVPAPGAPTGVSATAGNGQVTISWSAVTGATSYNLYWGTTTGVTKTNGTKVAGVTNPYVHTGRTNGTPYFYVVTAVNAGGESAESAQVGATPQVPAPSAPTGVSATAGNSQVTISWGAVTGASSYNLYWATAPGVSTVSTKLAGVTSPYVHTGLTNGTAYYYRVSAISAGGESPLSAEANATPQVPLSVTIVNLRNNGVVHSGFVIGTAAGTALGAVELSLDGGAFTAATGTTAWKFQLPTGGNTYRDGTQHSIAVRASGGGMTSAVTTLTVRKGVNRDINGDGYADLVVGAPGYSTQTGRAYVFHSRGASGVTAGATPQGAAAEADSILTGEATSNKFGNSVAIGDLNGDGYADLVVGAIDYGTQAGRVYVFHSRGASGVTAGATPQEAAAEAESILTGEATENSFGNSVATGDLNGDGYADLAVGAELYNTSTGRAYVFHSRGASGVTANATPVGAAVEAESILTGEATENSFGTSVAIGDLNGDGYADLVVGARGFSTSTGRAYGFHSRGASGVTANATPVGAAAEAESILTGEATSNDFGVSVAIGDVNGDGYADLVVGARTYSTNRGRAYGFHSRGASGVTANATPVGAAAEAESILDGEDADGNFGSSVATGDLNGDGYADLVVGAFNFGPSSTGRAHGFHSRGASGVTANATPVGAAAEAESILTGETINNEFGISVAR